MGVEGKLSGEWGRGAGVVEYMEMGGNDQTSLRLLSLLFRRVAGGCVGGWRN